MAGISPGRREEAGPPLPSLTLRVGVTGHRPNHLPSDEGGLLRMSIREVLELVGRVAL